MNEQELYELIDACRPGSDDVQHVGEGELYRLIGQDPEVRALYNRIQQLDRSTQAAVQQVEIPAGLESRLLAGLSAGSIAEEHPETERGTHRQDPISVATEAGADRSPPTTPRSDRSRRWLLGTLGLAMAAAIAWVVVGVVDVDPWPVDTEQLLAEARKTHRVQQGLLPENGDVVDQEEFPLSSHLQCAGVITSRLITFCGQRAGCYKLASRHGASATVFVVQRTGTQLPDVPAVQRAISTTGDLWVTAWQQGDYVYVLVAPVGSQYFFLRAAAAA